jgi:hypothetical protein
MYSDKRAFKRDELQWELRDEDAQIGAYNPYNSKPRGRKPRSPYVSVNVGVTVNALQSGCQGCFNASCKRK